MKTIVHWFCAHVREAPQEIMKWLNNHANISEEPDECFSSTWQLMMIAHLNLLSVCHWFEIIMSDISRIDTKMWTTNSCRVLLSISSNFSPFSICFIDFMITHIFEHTQFEIYIKCLIINVGVFRENNAKIWKSNQNFGLI